MCPLKNERWQTMMKHSRILQAALAAVALSACGGQESESVMPDVALDLWPSITSINATPTTPPAPGETVNVAAIASDPESDPLIYSWTDDCGGSFLDSTAATTSWKAPSTAAACKLTLVVRESGGPGHDVGHDSSSIDLQVTVAAPLVVYKSTPAQMPPSLVSHSFQATQTAEFGDSVTLSGTARKAASATIAMVTWQPDAYSYDITLNLYQPGDLGHPFATRTQRFDIPARPSADPSCSNGRWLASDGCHNGYAFPITFDLTGITLPDSFVFGIAYDTQGYGVHPTNESGFYNSLNVGLVQGPPSVGTKVEGTIYMNSSWAGAYGDGGSTGSFRQDTASDYSVPVEFRAYSQP